MTNFQIAVIGIFIFFIVFGVVVFAGYGGKNLDSAGPVVIWGTVDKNIMNELLSELKMENDAFSELKYREISEENFDVELAEALASGGGPDVFLLSQYSILKHKNKIFPIPYESYSARDFKDKFVEEGELYLTEEGVLGLPFIIDPLVMYWNRDIFSRNRISTYPKKWEEFFNLSQLITEKNQNLDILTSFVSFGEFRNVNHAKEIISTLIMQAGSPITLRSGDEVDVVFAQDNERKSRNLSREAVDFFIQFSNPTKSVYTWNRSLPNSQKFFLSGDLAVYFGFASELESLRVKNPNLNFDVAPVPQAGNDSNFTFGRMYALSIAKNSRNIPGSFRAIKGLTSNLMLRKLSEFNNLPPVSRDLLSVRPTSPYMDVFYKSAVSSRAWLDPEPQGTSEIFKNMVETIISGKEKTLNAIMDAGAEMELLISN